MDKSEIAKSLREKYDDEFTIDLFTNFVLEFQKCFSDIMDAQEVINRIKNNIMGNIIIIEEFDNKNMDAQYNTEGHIVLKRSVLENNKYMKYLCFHEMLHAITAIKDEDGNEICFGFSNRKTGVGKGFNEALTEYLTQIRNQKLDKDNLDLISGYRGILDAIKRMIAIIGEKTLMNCYFYDPLNLPNLLNGCGMNYVELENAFYFLYGRDFELNALSHGKKLNKPEAYYLYSYAAVVFDNYANAIGEVATVEDFERKYSILKPFENSYVDPGMVTLLKFFECIGKDIDLLIEKGMKFSDIKIILNKLNINVNVVGTMYKVSKCFTDDKNQSAVALYKLYKDNPDLYYEVFIRNYAMIFNHFSDSGVNVNENNLYDAERYPCIGAFLQQHPEVEFCDVSYHRVRDKASGIDAFIFSTSMDDERFAYDATGVELKKYKDKEGKTSFLMADNKDYNCVFTLGLGQIKYSFKPAHHFDLTEHLKNVNFQIDFQHSEKSDLEYFIENKQDHDGRLTEKLDNILSRISKRRSKNCK